jgi:small conductance mechanosensitive channel
VGDVIATGGQIGTVDAIEIFATTIDTSDNRRFIIPNSAIFGSVIENITYHPLRRAEVTVGVSYAADIDETRSVLMRAAASVSGRIKDREPAVTLSNLGPSSVDWSVQVWAKSLDYGNVRQALLRAVKMALDEVGIEIPYPQMAIHFQRSDLVEGREAGFASCLEPPARFHKAS